jgi:hypothetical protein
MAKGDIMPIHLTPEEFARLNRALRPTEEDTQPVQPTVSLPIQARPFIRPLTVAPIYTPRSQAFNVIDAALRLSGATNGAPIVEHNRGLAPYEIVITPSLRYRVSFTEGMVTVVTVIAGGQEQVTRYPKLSLSEFCRLFLMWRQ